AMAQITAEELDRGFDIKPLPRASMPERRTANAPQVIRRLCEMLIFRPVLAALAGPEPWQSGAGPAASVTEEDMALLSRLLELCRASPDIRSLAEHFRGNELEAVFKARETGSLNCQELGEDGLQVEFRDAWDKLLEQFRDAEAKQLRSKNLSPSA